MRFLEELTFNDVAVAVAGIACWGTAIALTFMGAEIPQLISAGALTTLGYFGGKVSGVAQGMRMATARSTPSS